MLLAFHSSPEVFLHVSSDRSPQGWRRLPNLLASQRSLPREVGGLHLKGLESNINPQITCYCVHHPGKLCSSLNIRANPCSSDAPDRYVITALWKLITVICFVPSKIPAFPHQSRNRAAEQGLQTETEAEASAVDGHSSDGEVMFRFINSDKTAKKRVGGCSSACLGCHWWRTIPPRQFVRKKKKTH